MKLKVNFLNSYLIRLDEDHQIDFNTINSIKIAKLLAYIIYYHRDKLSSNELQELMFGNGESNNPSNALKALIYRLRTILKNNLGTYDFILSSHGSYYWNPEIELDFDVMGFENYYFLGHDNNCTGEVRADYYKKAFYKYSGEFLPMIENVEKFLNIQIYLNSHFLNISRFLIEYYLKQEAYSFVEEICLATIVINEFDEKTNLILILVLVKQDKMVLARNHYNKIISNKKDHFSNNAIRKMESYLVLKNVDYKEQNILSIQEELIEDKSIGTYECDYDFFKQLYQIEARKAIRDKTRRIVALLTITPKKYVCDNPEVYNLVLEETSDILKEVILNSLRLGDIVCKYSTKQFLLLLDCNQTGAAKAIKRIEKIFLAQDKYERVRIEHSLVEITVAKVHVDNQNLLKIK